MKKLYNNKWIKWFVIPLFLSLVWIIPSVLFNPSVSFSVLTKSDSIDQFIYYQKGKLLQSDPIIGQFIASENNLGILSVRFDLPKRVDFDNEDILIFRIKEKGAQEWLYEEEYRSGGMYGSPFYPFGFPPIADSKGKMYVFSITSQKGVKENAVRLSDREPVLMSRYIFPKEELISDKKTFISYISKKIINSFTTFEFISSSIIYLLPLVFYLLIQLIVLKFRFDPLYFVFVAPLLIVSAIIASIDTVIGVFIGLIIFWIIVIVFYKIESSVSYLFAFLFFCFSFICILFRNQQLGSQLSNWIYIFLIIGALQMLYELQSSKNFVSASTILKKSISKKRTVKKSR